MLVCMAFFIGHWYLSLFCQSFFLHRYASHKMFELSPFWQKFFYIMTFVTQGTSFLNPSAYATLHNLHHEHSDRPEDPHSPHQNKNLLSMMWSTFLTYESFLKDKVKIPTRFRFKTFEKMDAFTDLWSIRLSWILVYVTFYYVFAPHVLYYLLIPIHVMMGPIHGAIVNWCGHKYGYRNFNLDDHSYNTLRIDFLMMGELYQNNHHKACRKWDFASKWYELDLTFLIMRVLHSVGIIRTDQYKTI